MKILTARDVAKELNLCLPTVYNLLQSGALPAVRCGTQWRITEESLVLFLRGQRPTDARPLDPAEAA